MTFLAFDNNCAKISLTLDERDCFAACMNVSGMKAFQG